jgi:hypothetical protein
MLSWRCGFDKEIPKIAESLVDAWWWCAAGGNDWLVVTASLS